jgi:hypothetical protein
MNRSVSKHPYIVFKVNPQEFAARVGGETFNSDTVNSGDEETVCFFSEFCRVLILRIL